MKLKDLRQFLITQTDSQNDECDVVIIDHRLHRITCNLEYAELGNKKHLYEYCGSQNMKEGGKKVRVLRFR